MTDAEIDALDGIALRRAVAAAVGWIISPIGFGSDDRFASSSGYRYLRSWDDVIAACESAQVRHIELFCGGVPRCRVSVEIGDRIEVFDNDGHSPESLLRALLKAIAAQNNAKLTAIG